MLLMLYIEFLGEQFKSFLPNYRILVHVLVQKFNTFNANFIKMKINCNKPFIIQYTVSKYSYHSYQSSSPFTNVHIERQITLWNCFSITHVIYISEVFSTNTMTSKTVQHVPFSTFFSTMSLYRTITIILHLTMK